MIATVDIDINAANPGMPLKEFAAFTSSPSHLRLRNVPRRIGLWELTKIYVAVTFPDNATRSVEATHNGALWTATVAGCVSSGAVRSGFQVIADGVDESGNSITGYVLGVGDVRIISRDSTVNVDGVTYPLKICEEMPADPKIGWCFTIDGVLSWYNGTEWIPLGGGSGDMSHAEFAELPVDDLEPDETGIPELCTVVNQIKNALRPAGAVALAALVAIAAHAASVEQNKLSNLKGGSNVVTRVDLDGLARMSDIPDVSAKQDRLPYPTNAIPHSAIVGVPAETDPTVPVWAKEDNKPEYTMEEIIDHDYIPASWIMNAPWLGRNGGTMTGSMTFNTANTGIKFNRGSTAYNNDSYSFFGPGTFLIIMPECLRLWNDHGTNYWDGCYYETLPEHLDRVVPAVSASTTSNVVTKAYVESLGIASGGIEDPVRHCTWVQCVTNGVFYWIVQEVP